MYSRNQHLQVLILPHNPSNNRHNPLRAPQARRARPLPKAPASRLPLSRVSEPRASIPRRARPLATPTNPLHRRLAPLKPGAAIQKQRFVSPSPLKKIKELTFPSTRTSLLPIPRPETRALNTPRALPLFKPAPARFQR